MVRLYLSNIVSDQNNPVSIKTGLTAKESRLTPFLIENRTSGVIFLK